MIGDFGTRNVVYRESRGVGLLGLEFDIAGKISNMRGDCHDYALITLARNLNIFKDFYRMDLSLVAI
jgi:hypothetical protein